jgi:hypothetical protein
VIRVATNLAIPGWASFVSSIALILLVQAITAYPCLFGEVNIENDLGDFHRPFRYFYSHDLAERVSFLWCTYVMGGIDIHVEGQVESDQDNP